jgi:hypothetical protein
VLDRVLREHRGTTLFHGWPERGIYQLSSGSGRAPLPALLSRANFLSVLRFPSRGHAAEFLAANEWHALCFDCVADGTVLEVADDHGGPITRPLAAMGRWLLRAASALFAVATGSDDHDGDDVGASGGAGASSVATSPSSSSSSSSSSTAASSSSSSTASSSISDEEKLSARLYGAMAVALMRDGPVLVLQASATDGGQLQTVPGAEELCSFAVTTAFDLGGATVALQPHSRLKFLQCQSLASVVLQAARTPVPSADLIPTREILSKL